LSGEGLFFDGQVLQDLVLARKLVVDALEVVVQVLAEFLGVLRDEHASERPVHLGSLGLALADLRNDDVALGCLVVAELNLLLGALDLLDSDDELVGEIVNLLLLL